MKRLMLAVMFSSIFFTGCSNQKVDNASNVNENVDAITEAHFDTEESEETKKQNTVEETKESEDAVLNIEVGNAIEESNIPSKTECIEKINKLEADLEVSLKDKYDSGITLDMCEAAQAEFQQWEIMLNDIINVLKVSLSEEEFNNLQKEQDKWLEESFEKAQESADEFEGGSVAPVSYTFSIITSFKERCFELIDLYFE